MRLSRLMLLNLNKSDISNGRIDVMVVFKSMQFSDGANVYFKSCK